MSRDALVVGINTYQCDGLQNLSAPANDAEAIAQRLQQDGNFNVIRLPEYLDPFEDDARRIAHNENVTVADLEAALEQLFYPEGNSIPDTALFYFSGHGLRKTGRRSSEGFLAASDANPAARNWGLSLKWLRELLQESPIRQQIVWLDCCYSGELLNFSEADPGNRGRARDRCFIAASREFEPVLGVNGEEYSAFTQAILRGFDLAPPSNQWVTNETLVTFLRQELKAEPQRFVSNNVGVINLVSRATSTAEPTPAIAESPPEQTCQAAGLATQLREWFETLDYKFESYKVWDTNYFEWGINIPTRRGYDRVVVRGVAGEASIGDFIALRQAVEQQRTDEGWLVTNRRISPACRTEKTKEENQHLYCYTLDELLDQTADFSGYLSWLEQEIQQRKIDQNYVPLACTKEEFDLVTKQRMGVSRYAAEDGWVDGYVDRWLDDPAKEHLSILGEFGTGKTWFVLHYAWIALQRYKDAKQRGVERPRLPLVIPLRDYAKAVSVESLFSEFFFRKHEIPIPGYSVFEQLNQMGKLLLIFDGFDEMAARINRQQMVNNFWELAKVVVPGAKVILTCRTEHFPEAKEGRALLSAELQASTIHLPFETPRFEVLELEKFNDDQIRQVLAFQAQSETVEQVMSNPALLDLARRPVMTELVIEALPEIEAGKPIDIARVYLYAVRHKMQRDIKAERTFTSLADKLYFLCELSWEMLSTDRMSINYVEFPDRIRTLFSSQVQEEKDLDHWQYDMMGQTMLIRNAEGDYSPAHRSLLEFFVAYKLVAELGILAPDFTELAQAQAYLDDTASATVYTWTNYFQRQCGAENLPLPIAPLHSFTTAPLEQLMQHLADSPLAKAVLDLAVPMLDKQGYRERLLALVQTTRAKQQSEVWYFGGNLVKLLLGVNPYALEQSDLSQTVLMQVNFAPVSLRWVNLVNADLTGAVVAPVLGGVNSVTFSPDSKYLAIGDSRGTIQLWETATRRILLFLQGHQDWVRSVAFSPDGERIASGGADATVRLWDLQGNPVGQPFQGHQGGVRSVAFSPDGERIASGSDDATVRLWDLQGNPVGQPFQGHEGGVRSVAFSPDGERIVSGSDDATVRLWDLQGNPVGQPFQGHQDWVRSVAFSPDGERIVSGGGDATVRLWDLQGNPVGQPFQGHEDWVRSVAFSPNGERIASGSDDATVRLWDLQGNPVGQPFQGHERGVWSVALSPDGERIASGSDDATVRLWDLQGNPVGQPFQGHQDWVRSVAFSPDGERIVSGGIDATVRLWDLQGNPVGQPFQGHEDWVRSVTFSPDGERIVSGGDDETLRLWNAATGECLQVINCQHCAGLNITGATGLTSAQRTALKLMGAIDEEF
ncbi:caspase family protein [Oculatella sp. FACHB-28]|uniref:caspase family protein n=1 Tax=Oculatella sp. FACHB-28 TaxID=2692845 RepID=UPI0016864B1B|nr:caspase family protein [Oculatella sp. FACHB-28]MBD2060477.1 caspase family protein [Oculatella sp. FACHB-28]